MKLLQKYFKIIHEIYEYFDYSTNDRILPLEDYKEFYWKVKNKIIYYSANKDEINDFSDNVVAVYVVHTECHQDGVMLVNFPCL